MANALLYLFSLLFYLILRSLLSSIIQIICIMKRLTFILAIFLLISLTTTAQPKRWNVSFGGGGAIPTDDASDFIKAGYHLFSEGMYCFNSQFSAGLQLGYSNFPGKNVYGIELDKTTVSSFLLKGVYSFTEVGLRPFVGVYAGLYSTKLNASFDAGEFGTISTKATDDNFGYAIEGGASFGALRAAISYHVAVQDFKFVTITVGYSFRF